MVVLRGRYTRLRYQLASELGRIGLVPAQVGLVPAHCRQTGSGTEASEASDHAASIDEDEDLMNRTPKGKARKAGETRRRRGGNTCLELLAQPCATGRIPVPLRSESLEAQREC